MTAAEIEQIKSDHARLGERIAALEAQSQQRIIEIPARRLILNAGEEWGGTLFGLNGAPNSDLILLPHRADPRSWQEGMDWAAGLGGELPDRREGRLLWVNLAECFEQGWHWLREQHVSLPGYAWLQDFEDGGQDWSHENCEFHCRAVRRSVIQSSSIFELGHD